MRATGRAVGVLLVVAVAGCGQRGAGREGAGAARVGRAAAPRGIQLEVPADVAAELGTIELRLAASAPAGAPASTSESPSTPSPGPAPAARALLRRAELGRVSRSCLLLPAPGALAVPVAALAGDTLAVSVGVLDRCWRAVDGTLERSAGRSDGA